MDAFAGLNPEDLALLKTKMSSDPAKPKTGVAEYKVAPSN